MSGKAEVHSKYENQQKTGSFKVRGAYNQDYEALTPRATSMRCVASSAGNHAQGVRVRDQFGRRSLPSSCPVPHRLQRCPRRRATALRLCFSAGNIHDEAYAKACEICEETGAEFIHPFDDEDVMAGQARSHLEILRDLPSVDII